MPDASCLTSLETILKHTADLQTYIDFIDSVRAELSQENVTQWCSDQVSVAFASLSVAKVRDIPTLMSIVAMKGFSSVVDVSVFSKYARRVLLLPQPSPAFSRSWEKLLQRLIFGWRLLLPFMKRNLPTLKATTVVSFAMQWDSALMLRFANGMWLHRTNPT